MGQLPLHIRNAVVFGRAVISMRMKSVEAFNSPQWFEHPNPSAKDPPLDNKETFGIRQS